MCHFSTLHSSKHYFDLCSLGSHCLHYAVIFILKRKMRNRKASGFEGNSDCVILYYCISTEAAAAANGSRLKKSRASSSSLSNRCCLATGLYYARHMWCIQRNLGTLLERFAVSVTSLKHCVCVYVCSCVAPQRTWNLLS